jgi:hypothetical protein
MPVPPRPARLAALAAALLAAVPAAAATTGDWPCVQRKVTKLSIGQMWSGPEAKGDWQEDAAVRDLANRLAARRTSLEEAETLVAAFADQAGDAKGERLALLFAGVFDIIDRERGQVVSGIERYAKRQQALSDRIRDESRKLEEVKAKGGEGGAATDAAEEAQQALTWDTRIYEEREQSLTYVCEVPVLFEQRAFALARMMLKHLQ